MAVKVQPFSQFKQHFYSLKHEGQNRLKPESFQLLIKQTFDFGLYI